MSQKLTSLPKDYDHSAKMIKAKSDRQHLLKEVDTLNTMRSQGFPNIPDPQLGSPRREDFHAQTLKCRSSSHQAYSLLEHEVPGQGVMFLLWNLGMRVHIDSMSVK